MKLVVTWFWRVWRGSGGTLALIVVLSIGSAVLLTVFPWLWQFLIDALQEEDATPKLREVALWMLVAGVAQYLLYNVLQGARAITNARIQWRARRVVFEHLTEMDAAFFRRWRSGDLVTRMYDDAGDKIAWFMCSGIFRAFEAAMILLVCLTVMVVLDPWLTLWVVLPLPVLIAGQGFAQGALGRRYSAVQAAITGINDELSTTFGGIRIVQACRLTDTATRRFERRAAQQRDAEVHSAKVQQAVFLMYGFGWQLAVVALLLAGGAHVIDGSLTLGRFITFEGFLTTLVWPMFDLGMLVSKYRQAGVALERLEAVLDDGSDESPGGEAPLESTRVEAVAAGVVAADGATLLDGVDLLAEPGELVAVVGEVGAGKSILMSLLAGLREPRAGEIRLGGTPRTELDRVQVLSEVALVPQDPVLLSTTVRDNILLGREVDAAAFDEALEVSRLRQDLGDLPDGLDTRVGERGVTLSGGQQQRVALARALVGGPRILLLDDATAALDADTEAAFWDLLGRAGDRTTIVVTHRLGTLERADRIVVLERGQVVQRGRHAALIEAEGAYRAIYGRLQARARVA